MSEKPIHLKVWPMRNEALKRLPEDCRLAIIEEIVKEDVRLCIQEHGIHDKICQDLAEESGEMEEYLLSNTSPTELPIYKIKGKFYFRDERLREYRNTKDPHDRLPIDSVDNRDLEKPTAEDTKKVYGKCDKNPCDLVIKGKRKELGKWAPYDTKEEMKQTKESWKGLSKHEKEFAEHEWKAKQERLLRMEREDK